MKKCHQFRRYIMLFCIVVQGSFIAQGCSAESGVQRFQEGVHYTVVSRQAKKNAGGKVSVVEFFSFACPHCYSLEPVMNKWKETAASHVDFSMMPAFWNPYFQLLAHAYYTADVLKVKDKVVTNLFEALHLQGRQLKSEGALADFFVEHGVAKADFDKTFNSFSVKQKVKLANTRFKQFDLKGVPGVVVGGKYFTDVKMAGSREAITEVIDFLVRKSKKEQS
ncbi:MAG: thiol:disulfide interchange protein DsbA/DsbL [Pseudomonadales bacterium]|nr:thiol:disulfide interchange protein DsbA/DsbL [Pseudomonadales bacterium]